MSAVVRNPELQVEVPLEEREATFEWFRDMLQEEWGPTSEERCVEAWEEFLRYDKAKKHQ